VITLLYKGKRRYWQPEAICEGFRSGVGGGMVNMDQHLKSLPISLNFFSIFLSSSAIGLNPLPRGIGTSASQPSPSHLRLVLLLSHLIVFLTSWPHSIQVIVINASSVGCLLMADEYKRQVKFLLDFVCNGQREGVILVL